LSKIYVIHENGLWLGNLRDAFANLGLPYEEWDLTEGTFDLSASPPKGVFYNRMSASSHTRGHRYSAELTSVVLNWLDSHSRRVINNSRALQLEINKGAQLSAFRAGGVPTPRSIAVMGQEQIIQAADTLGCFPFIIKPNRGGTGDGVHLMASKSELDQHIKSAIYQAPIDGISLLQEYIYSPNQEIIRTEFIGGKFMYAVRVDARDGFELCPADVCQVEGAEESGIEKFRILPPSQQPSAELLDKCEGVLAANDIEVAAIEFVYNASGQPFAYDLNTNTNYNDDVEQQMEIFGMQRLAYFLGQELSRLKNRVYVQHEDKIRLAG
jgi:hypothetical protein